ncbi:uncharacterized protein B0H64DRAFT_321809 [Chaetomium fimeti]|uniref:Uncharacterized protein n=1 Tax=Chaetomium fimeti TaxID=1854472 RepID=A0AAE0LSH7_9PEZI|nr:hypothetical protein B0H64DRAFT_321809 [Chaetomium fimeti]
MPLALAVLRVVLAVYSSYTVGGSLYQSHKALGPAQDTRNRKAERIKLTAAFGSLAALGLVFAVTSGLEYLTLSYKVWASERGVAVPDSLFGNHTLTTDGANGPGLYLKYWLSDTPVFLDALEIITEKARRLWWGQQLDLATISWTALLAVEGRRRRIPHLWAYSLLPHLVSLSFAQNLFYVALLQTPSPIAPRETRIAQFLHGMLPKKPHNWFPKLSLLLVPLVANYLVILRLPNTVWTPSFPTAVGLSKVLTLAPLILPAIAPASWGTVHSDPRDAYPDITKLFNIISASSALLHARTTLSALRYNLPDSSKHRHSLFTIPLDTEERSKWERTATAVEKVLSSMTDHPAVAAAGKDVLLSTLGLGLWAAVRSTDVASMLRSMYSTPEPRRLTQPSKPESKPTKPEPSPSPEEDAHPTTPTPALGMTLRRRGRAAKGSSISSTGSSNAPGDDTTTTTTAHQPPKRRGRPRKVKPEPGPEPEPEPELKLEPEHHEPEREEGVPDEDKTYQPTPAVRAEVGLGDVVPEGDFDWESAALAWGVTVLGGLGLGSATVFGGECLAR